MDQIDETPVRLLFADILVEVVVDDQPRFRLMPQ